MAFFPLPVQAQPFSLSGAGAVAGATSVTLKSFLQIDGVTPIVMADFGSVGYGTLEPGNSTLEEQISFTGVTQNVNGTATLTGVSTVLFVTPFTETSGLAQTHAGSTAFIISNDAGFYNAIKSYIDTAVSAGAVPATTLVNGIGKVSVAPVDPAHPIFVGQNDPLVPTSNEIASLAGLSGNTPNAANPLIDSRALTGMVIPSVARTAPVGFLLCDGTAVSRATYANLLAVIAPSGTFTVTIATPAVFTKTAHGLVAGDKLSFTTTGGLPTGLAVNTDYFVISAGLTANAFEVSASLGGSAVNTTGSQSGTHTLYVTNYGKGDGSTTFNVPDMRGLVPYGYKSSDANFNILNSPTTYVGEKTHVLITAELASHAHTLTSAGSNYADSGSGSAGTGAANLGFSVRSPTATAGSDTAHNNMPPYGIYNYFIKT